MFDDESILQIITGMIKPEYIGNSKILLRNNKSNYNSIIVATQKTAYRFLDADGILFARIKTSGDLPYISFKSKYAKLFRDANISFQITAPTKKSKPTKSPPKNSKYIFIDLDVFSPFSVGHKKLPDILNKIFIDLFSFPSFGCCSKYVECSNIGHCIHDDLAYATGCMYRKNLESGKIFYGVNKNIQ